MLKRLFRTKSLDAFDRDIADTSHGLKRVLGPIDLIALGIGAIIGAGIFATVGTAAAGDAVRLGAGPALILSFLVTGIACGFAALCYAEFAAMVPIAGSAYTYSYATLGELLAWIIGWDLIIEYAIGNVAVAISWSGYFRALLSGFGLEIPNWLATDFRSAYALASGVNPMSFSEKLQAFTAQNWSVFRSPEILQSAPQIFGYPLTVNLPAAAIVLALTVILVWGVKESARFNTGMVIVKLITLGFFVVVGVWYIKPENWTPFIPNGWAGVSAGAAIVFFAYIGFDAVSTTAEETRNPARDMPIGIIGSLLICTLIYVVVAAVITGIIPWNQLNVPDPLYMAFKMIGKDTSAGIVAFGSVVAHTAVLFVFQLGQPRIFFSMARDGLLPAKFAAVHPKFRTPHVATIITGVFVAVFAAFASLDEMVDLTNIGTLSAFVLVCAGIIVLRKKDPKRKRPFRCPWSPWIPLAGMFSCFYLMIELPWVTWRRFGIWLLVGMVIYLSYGLHRSKLNPHSPR